MLVELDGRAWRALPTEVVVRSGLCLGLELERGQLRALARELRRSRALDVAARSLARRDCSIAETRERLERQGIPPAAREEALETLTRIGALDDRRFARARAQDLAERGFGDAAVSADLERAGVASELAALVLTELEPEGVRARRIALARGADLRTARYLARRGFDLEVIETAIPASVAEEG